jgi:hypothetical protein
MKKLLALIKTKGKSKKEIADEVRKVLKRKKVLDGDGKLNITDNHNHQNNDKLNSKN